MNMVFTSLYLQSERLQVEAVEDPGDGFAAHGLLHRHRGHKQQLWAQVGCARMKSTLITALVISSQYSPVFQNNPTNVIENFCE